MKFERKNKILILLFFFFYKILILDHRLLELEWILWNPNLVILQLKRGSERLVREIHMIHMILGFCLKYHFFINLFL